jgi:uncharacterized RDD family membrane protein YckC
VTKTCSQCGAILPSSVRACNFCDSSFSVGVHSWEESSENSTRGNSSLSTNPRSSRNNRPQQHAIVSRQTEQDAAWRGELAQRLDAYRTRRRRLAPNSDQSQFSFDNPSGKTPPQTSAAVEELPASLEGDFSFTIAIGRPSKKRVLEESQVLIDVSHPPDSEASAQEQPAKEERRTLPGLHPVASIDDRRLSGLIDLLCLLFAYGGFLMLFGSLGGQFTVSKLNAAVCATTFAIVYLEYFALFTIFGGTTPGMMMRGLQVVGFSGEPPTPRQMLLRSAGYMLSAGTFFLGYLWVMWDEDELTWHDRLSRTHLSAAETFADLEESSVVHSR